MEEMYTDNGTNFRVADKVEITDTAVGPGENQRIDREQRD